MQSGRFSPLLWVGYVIAIIIGSAGVLPVFAQTVAHDDASSAAYNSGWTNGQASGMGFSNWTLQLPPDSSAGVASSTDNDHFMSLANINTGSPGRALRLVSNNGTDAADAVRTFTNGPLQVGQVFTIWIDNGEIKTGGVVGFGLRNSSNNDRFEMYFSGAASNYTINSHTGPTDSVIPFTFGGLRVSFLLEKNDQYRMNVVRNGASSANLISNATLLTSTAGTSIDRFRVFNFNAGSRTFEDSFFSNQFDISNGFIWDGGATTDHISLPENWKLDVPPIRSDFATMYFDGTTGVSPIFAGGNNRATIEFSPGAGPFVLRDEAPITGIITVMGGVINKSSNVQKINLQVQMNPTVDFGEVAVFDTGSLPGGGLETLSNGTLDLTIASRTLHWTGANPGTIGAPIVSLGKVLKTGSGLLHLSSSVTHTYAGTTTITGGTFRVDGTLGANTELNPEQAVTVGNGSPNTGVLAGSGTINRPVVINSGGTISPGSGNAGSPSTIAAMTINTGVNPASGLLTLEGGGTYVVELNRRADQGTEGTNWDRMNLAAMTVNATSGNKFVVKVVGLTNLHQPGAVQNWDPDVPQTWRVASVSGTVTGFDTDDFQIDVSQFANNNALKSLFFLWRSGGDINLTYVPEPTWMGIVICSTALLMRSRRNRI